MKIDVSSPESRYVLVRCPHSGEKIEAVYAADTDAGYLDRFVRRLEPGRFVVAERELMTERVYRDFDLVDCRSGAVIATARGSGPEKCHAAAPR